MRAESSSATASSSSAPSPSGKRSRDPEDEVYVDNLHSHKRYLSEIMASSLNGLTVGDPLPEYLLESPARSEATFSPRDEMAWQYSPMSEDSDDTRLSETPMNTYFSHPDSRPTSPVSPYRKTSERILLHSFNQFTPFTWKCRRCTHAVCSDKTQPAGQSSLELQFGPGQENSPSIEVEEQRCSCVKSLIGMFLTGYV
ncbi:putative phosphoribosylamine-glycine ligase [Hibiscus syriacus]|uniref:Phosphoribosylamine-glycine ligase n=1 Tax=Hibiscus syriacus TaxID=106335 RepID=A0A6A3A3R9_HIBSY|nr:putative phosphoribosylamine-glycine ligase [Hibiscus syriacus]